MTKHSRAIAMSGVAAVAGLLGLQTPVHAQGVIRGCMNPAGQVRIIGATDTCRSQETLVTWNTSGPAGEKGDKGDKGDQGDPGIKGDKGDPGADAPGVTGGVDRG